MPARIRILFCFFCFPIFLNAQILDTEEDKFPHELCIGFNSNTNGGLISGLNMRYTYKKDDIKYRYAALEFVNVKHEREIRTSSVTNSSFIPGKINYLFALRPSYGGEKTLFKKYPENGVRLGINYAGGPTIGLLKPYYVNYITGTNSTGTLTKVVAYNPHYHSMNLVDSDAGVFYGMKASKINIGAHFRGALNFEYGPGPYLRIGVETGITMEAYTKKNILLENNEARRLYSAFFMHFYYGVSF